MYNEFTIMGLSANPRLYIRPHGAIYGAADRLLRRLISIMAYLGLRPLHGAHGAAVQVVEQQAGYTRSSARFMPAQALLKPGGRDGEHPRESPGRVFQTGIATIAPCRHRSALFSASSRSFPLGETDLGSPGVPYQRSRSCRSGGWQATALCCLAREAETRAAQ